MSGNVKEILDTLEAVQRTANEVRELLSKSMPPPPALNKADDQDADDAPPAAPEGDVPPPAAPEGDVPPPAAPEGDVPPPPPGEGQEGGQGEFEAELASMSDEELTALLQALAGEMDKRKSAQPPAEGGVPPAAESPAAPSPEMDAMKSENVAMKKSIQGLQSEIAELKKSLSRPASRPAAMNKPTVQTKVETKPEMLSKSEVLTHLESLKKSGNRAVDTDLIWKANSARSNDDLAAVYHEAKVKGIEIPNKK